MEAIIAIVVWGFVVGSLARFAVPGPDPMPWWLTIAFGVGGSFVALAVAGSVLGEPTSTEAAGEVALTVFVASLAVTTLAIILYRRLVQKRGITGPAAQRAPERGIGVRPSGEPASDGGRADAAARLRELSRLRDEGLISDDEFESKRRDVLQQL